MAGSWHQCGPSTDGGKVEPVALLPKGMWWKTYQRLRDRFDRDEMVHWRQLMEKYQLPGVGS
jgi:hypothetical protein